jgi:small glutamine-rich tetratricopeptide repeat-containing protein alpha
MEIFARGVASIEALESNGRWPQFLALLKEKGFFAGAEEGSLEHAKRMEQARAKFEAKYAAESTSGAAASAPAPTPVVVSAEDKAKAEVAKNAGNALLQKGDHAGAVAKYTEAISLNPTHAIYLANRAAAHVNLRQYARAVEDCKASIALDPNYAKSHYRLGQAHAALGEHQQALNAFERALQLSSNDEGMAVTIREQIKQAKNKLNPPVSNSMDMDDDAGADGPFGALNGMGGMGGLANLLGGLGGGAGGEGGAGGLGGLMQMMQNPAMQEMMKNLDIGALMKDPSMAGLMGGMAQGMAEAPAEPAKVDTSYKPPSAASLFDDDDATPAAAAAKPAAAAAPKPAAAAAGSGSGAGGAGGALPPQLSSFLSTPAGRAAASDPELAPVLEDIKANGMGAAMKYLSNPKIMQKISVSAGRGASGSCRTQVDEFPMQRCRCMFVSGSCSLDLLCCLRLSLLLLCSCCCRR